MRCRRRRSTVLTRRFRGSDRCKGVRHEWQLWQQEIIPVYEGIVDGERQNEVDQLLLHLVVALLACGDLALMLSPEVE